MPKKSRVTKTWLVLRYWCQASRIQGCGMVLNPTEWNRFTTQIAYVLILADILNRSCDPAWLRGGTTDITNARTCHFLLSDWQSSHSNFDLKPSQLDSTKKKPIRSGFMIWSAVFLLRCPETLLISHENAIFYSQIWGWFMVRPKQRN